jgi:hypothetical protein
MALSAIAFRAIERIFILMTKSIIPIFEYFNFHPSWKSAELWFLRYGLYKLTRAKKKASDWIVILDFKVQAGCQKCLIVLGVQLSTLTDKFKMRNSFDIHHEDFEPLALQPMNASNGEKVAKVLEEISDEIGPFLQIVADHGGDINKGVKIYCQNHNTTINTYDVVHKLAILLKNELEKKDDIWKQIISLITDTKQKTKQSPEAFLSPPKQREKARFMNADIQIDWLQEILVLLQMEEDLPYIDRERLIDKLGWVLDFDKTIEEYVQMINIIRLARHQIRTKGLHRYSYKDFSCEIRSQFRELKSRSKNLVREICSFLKEEGKQISKDMTLVGSSEGIESTIGRQKIIVERTKVTTSITRSILSLAAIVGENSQSTIQEALETVSMKTLEEWEYEWIGKSDLAKRKEVRSIVKEKSTKSGKLGSESLAA